MLLVIVRPSVFQVAAPYAEKLGYSIAVTVGGKKVEQNLKKLKNIGSVLKVYHKFFFNSSFSGEIY